MNPPSDRIHIEALEVSACVGVPEDERSLETHGPLTGLNDEIARTIDYFEVCHAAQIIAAERPRKLIETVAEEIANGLLARFALRSVHVELRKYVLPETAFVAVHIHKWKPSA
jgi:dihydroneopterin aldolase